MLIDIVGNMCTWTKELSASYIIDGVMLFDVPQGSFKTLLNDYNLQKVKYIVISHFHSDHFMDIHLVIDYIYHHTDTVLTIIAPKGCKERLSAMFKIVEVSYLEDALTNRIKFIDCENNKIFKLDDYKFKAFKMVHAGLDAYGFTIEKDGVVIGFTGDSAMCNNVRKILAKSQAVFIDTAQDHITNKHLCVEEVMQLIKEYPNCQIYPIHLSRSSEKLLKENNIYFPRQGDVIDFK